MAQLKFGSAGVTATEIDLTGPVTQEPTGIPAGIIGTANKGRAFIPITVGNYSDFSAKFGNTDGEKFGPLAVYEWLKNAGSVTYLRVMGVGDGLKRLEDGNTAGSVLTAGFVVGEQQPGESGNLGNNPYANLSPIEGRTYFLGCLMSESAGSTVFSSAGLQTGATAVPIVRGVLMAASGVILALSSSQYGTNTVPDSTHVAGVTATCGGVTGSVVLLNNSISKEEFVLFLNGHKGTNTLYPNYITASFDMTSPSYFGKILNKDPYSHEKAGYTLYANWDMHPTTAAVTGTGLVTQTGGLTKIAFLTTGSANRNVGTAYVPNYENFEDRFSYARTPWVISQKFGGNYVDLFRLHSIDAGLNISNKLKFSIENLVPSSDLSYKYGTFDLVIRDWNDSDSELRIYEAHRGLSLDPESDRYIAKIIGDVNAYYDFDRTASEQKVVIDGNYSSNSNYIRVEVSNQVDQQAVDPTALPFGVRGIPHLVTSGSLPLTSEASATWIKRTTTPPVVFRDTITAGAGVKASVNPLLYWGYQFEHITSLDTKNASKLANESMKSFVKYYPGFMTSVMNFAVGDNPGAVDTSENGIIDADRFNRTLFTLDNVQIVTGSSTLADSSKWKDATYVRSGLITASDSAKTRRLSTSDLTQANRRFVKFTFPMFGGFDGTNMFDREETKISNTAVTYDMLYDARGRNNGSNVQAYLKAIEVMKNTVNAEIQLLAIPGIRHELITDTAIIAVEERFDAMFVMDIEETDADGNIVLSGSQLPSVSRTVETFTNRSLNSSFSAAYFPDTLMQDPTTKTNLHVPPSVMVLGALALNDAVGYPWFAPAGFTRGALADALEAKVRLSKENLDSLYDVNINPLVAFPGNATQGTNPAGGVLVWGQKTVYQTASALDRVNVRRLLIELRRQVRDVARTILFEPNRAATLARFTAAVTPKLERIQSLAGIEQFRVIIDSSTTTQADVENNTVRGKIIIQPTKTVEFVSLDFVVSNNI